MLNLAKAYTEGPSLYLYVSMSLCLYVSMFRGKAVFKRPLSPTISFLPCRIEGPLFDTGFSAVRHLQPRRARTRLPDTCTLGTASSVRARRASLHLIQ